MFKSISLLIIIALVCTKQLQAQTRDLSYYLRQANNNSPLLKDYQNQIKSGKLDSMLISAANRPQILANGQVALYPYINNRYGYDPVITNGGNYTGVIAASQRLFNKNILKPQYEQASIQNMLVANQAAISTLDLSKNITNQYITAYSDWQQLQVTLEVYHILQSQQQLLKSLVQQGVYKQTDYLTFLTNLQSQEISVNQLQIVYKADLSMLNYLCGIDDTSNVLLDEPYMAVHNETITDSSVFLQQYQIDSLRIQNQRSIIASQYKPALSWFADAGLEASRINEAYHDFGASFGLNFSVPIYDGKQRKLKNEQLNIAERTRESYDTFYHRQYSQQIRMLQQQLQATNSLVENIQQKLKTQELLIDINKKLLNTGDVRITDYILALNNYLAVKSNLNQIEVSRYDIINQLNYWNH
jgi:outer membrane protein TolC